MATADQFLAVLDSWVAAGIHEDPPHSNKTVIGEEYGWNGVAWCCETQSVAQVHVGMHCFHEASVNRAKSLAQQGVNGMQWLPANAVIRKGDMPCFQWADGGTHIACVRDPGTQTKFQTDAGNENDRMTTQWRDRTYVTGFIRLPFDAEPQPTPTPAPTPEVSDVPIICRPVPDAPGNPNHNPDIGAEFLLTGSVLIELSTPDQAQQFKNSGIATHDFETLAWALLNKGCTRVT